MAGDWQSGGCLALRQLALAWVLRERWRRGLAQSTTKWSISCWRGGGAPRVVSSAKRLAASGPGSLWIASLSAWTSATLSASDRRVTAADAGAATTAASATPRASIGTAVTRAVKSACLGGSLAGPQPAQQAASTGGGRWPRPPPTAFQ